MAFLNRHGQKAFVLFPAIVSWAAAAHDAPIFLIVTLLSMLIVAEAVPLFRRRECVGVFLMTTLSAAPWAFKIGKMIKEFLLPEMPALCVYSFCATVSFAILSIADIVLCLAARIIWREQEAIEL